LSPTKTTLVAVFVLMLTFGAGFIGGAAVHHIWIAHREQVTPFAMKAMVNRLDRRLDLTDAQRAQIEQILQRRHERINDMWAGVRPRVRTEVEATNAEIMRVLTPEQRAKFEKMRMHLGGMRGHLEGKPRTESTR
jgi:Spy/CpxP family protein refolding chaperone